uniref:HlyIII-domain-containing protein n=1 Tax=Parastrongyloides trichosuri TaxID=131310 RepID=A0A0N5A4Q8_PARTI
MSELNEGAASSCYEELLDKTQDDEETENHITSLTPLTKDFEAEVHDGIVDLHRSTVQKKMNKFFACFPKLIDFENLPDWMKDNRFIKSGYRAPTDSLVHVCYSLAQFHNETVNIWSHILGSLIFISCGLWVLTRSHTMVPQMTKLVFLPFFLGAVSCMSCSAAFHLLLFKSQRLGTIFAKLDYSGIALLIIGSFIPWVYFSFICHNHLMIIYNTSITALGLLAIIVSLYDKFAEPKFRPVRAGVFLTMGLSAIIPCFHLLLIESWDIIKEQELLKWNIIMGCMYVFGALQYALRVPERFFHGKCDYLFSSHQFFHIFVVLAATIHFYGISKVAVYKMSSGSCAEQEVESGTTLWKKWFNSYG